MAGLVLDLKDLRKPTAEITAASDAARALARVAISHSVRPQIESDTRAAFTLPTGLVSTPSGYPPRSASDVVAVLPVLAN